MHYVFAPFTLYPDRAELDESTTLDDGDPVEFGHFHAAFGQSLPNLRLVGGCCGSDHRHVGDACRHLHEVAGVGWGSTPPHPVATR